MTTTLFGLCTRHQDALELAMMVRGFLQPSLTADADLAPLKAATDLLVRHCTNFAGAGVRHLIRTGECPLCFVNRNPAGTNLDDWIDRAADEIGASASMLTAPERTLVT